MSPRSIRREVTGLWAPSVLIPDWNQVQVSMSSACGQTRAISRTIVAVECSATSCSGTPTATASTTAAPPMSAIRVIFSIWAISSADLIILSCMAGWAMSTNSISGNSALSRFSRSMLTWSNSIPSRRTPPVSWRMAWK